MRFPAQAFLFPGEVMLTGISGPTVSHAHLALQITISLGNLIRFETSADEIVESDAHLFKPLEMHRVHGDEPSAVLFLAPRTSAVRQTNRQPLIPTLEAHHALAVQVREFASLERNWDEASELVARWKRTWFLDLHPAPFVDSRIAKALDHLDSGAAEKADRYSLANTVVLSPSRFAALFAADVGLPLRRYLLWRRLILAVKLMSEGANVTEAAVEAGFADTSHMSRVFLRTFGLSPSILRKMRIVTSPKHPLIPLLSNLQAMSSPDQSQKGLRT
ncbi:MAG: helix-turn-helix domain-containing protein [Beijerinckiaceae bacterium]